MAILKCKMCGGDLNITADEKIVECEFCGTTQTIPDGSNEKKTNLFNRANRLRIANEFDKAAGIYESIIAEFPDEAESYWGLCLCKFGIEYVDDPKTAKKIPTCHRTSFESIFDDENYKMALEKSDVIAQGVYKEEATVIDNLQKDILSIVHKEEPFDVFICYKETDELGQRTQDSVLAQDIYDALTDKGFKVFFSRITLEDKLGKQYEPYIFAALNSAKVMLAIGTKEEYYNAVWVKNEWSRFLALMESDKSKMLIPCYRDIDPYDMPQEFKNLQGQDMSKLGFLQDLARGVSKIVAPEQNKPVNAEPAPTTSANATTDSLLKRAFMFLEDGDWQSADEYCEKVLDINPECALAYFGKLMAELKIAKKTDLKEIDVSFANDINYQKATRFGDEKFASELRGYMEEAGERFYKLIDTHVVSVMQTSVSAGDYHTVGLKKDGTVMAVGENGYGECNVSGWKDIVMVSAGSFHTVGLKKDGTVVAVGNNKDGQCDVSGWKDIVMVSAGYDYTVGLKKDGTVVAVGKNDDGECKVSDWKDIVMVSAGDYHTVALKKDGTVVAVGNNKDGQYDVSGWKDIVMVSARGAHTVGLKKDGTVVAVGKNDDGECKVSDWKDIVMVSAGDYHTVGLKKDGTVVAVGKNDDGECKVSDWKDIVMVSAGDSYTVGLKKDGTVMAVGEENSSVFKVSDFSGISVPIHAETRLELYEKMEVEQEKLAEEKKKTEENRKKFEKEMTSEPYVISVMQTSVSAGSYHTVGLKKDGTVVAVGYNGDGECKVSDWKDIVMVSARGAHTVGLKKDGTVVAVGKNDDGECKVSDWKDIVMVSAGDYHTVGLKKDGTVVAVGKNDDGECKVSDWKDIVMVSVGNDYTVGLKKDGTVVAVGENDDGRCEVSDWKDIVMLSAGSFHTVGLKTDGTVVAVGYNDDGECKVSDWKDIVMVSAGEVHTVGLKKDGTVVAVGENYHGQCDVSGWKDIVMVSAGSFHTVGLKKDGTVVAVGKNYAGQCNVSGWNDIATPIFAESKQEMYEKRKKQIESEQELIAEKQRQEEQKIKEHQQLLAQRQANGLCQHCGGSFKGFFTKTCTECGKKKDY